MYYIYFYNFNYVLQDSFSSIEEATEAGSKTGFEFYICQYVDRQWKKIK